MRFRKPKEDTPRLGLAPLVDVVFLLLIFFMLTAHFQGSTGMSVRLPELGAPPSEQRQRDCVVVLDASGTPHIQGEPVSLETLREGLRKQVQTQGADRLVLQADENTPHGKVVAVMDAAQQCGLGTIFIAAVQPASNGTPESRP